MVIRMGDKVWVQGIKKHYGVCTGYGSDGEPWFVHNVADGGVVHTTRKGFAGNRQIYIEQRAALGNESVVVARALALVGRAYDMIFFNCEHVANLAANGAALSVQVQIGVTVVSILSAGLLALVNQNGTSVDAGGYRRNGSGQFAARRWW